MKLFHHDLGGPDKIVSRNTGSQLKYIHNLTLYLFRAPGFPNPIVANAALTSITFGISSHSEHSDHPHNTWHMWHDLSGLYGYPRSHGWFTENSHVCLP
jgi:hypothetical protein